MEFMGIRKSPSGLELTIAVPGHGLSSSFGSDGGSGCKNGSARELVLLDVNHPAASGGEELQMGSVDDEEERGGGGGSQRPKKLRLSSEQYRLLEQNFRLNHTVDPRQREALAGTLKLRPRQVEVWFQNRRARSKLKNTEMECEYLRQCLGTLTKENRRLQREVEELRAVRVPAAALATPFSAPALAVVCPHCERVVTPAAAAQQAAGAWATKPSPSSSYPLRVCCPSLAL